MKKAHKSGQDGNHNGEKSKSAKLPKAAAPEVVMHPVEEALLRHIKASEPLGLPAYLLLSLAQAAGMRELTGDGLMKILEDLKGYGKIGEAKLHWHLASQMPAPKPGEMSPEEHAIYDSLNDMDEAVSRAVALLRLLPGQLWQALRTNGEPCEHPKDIANGIGYLADDAADILKQRAAEAWDAYNAMRRLKVGQGQGAAR